jgi:hypothetical protein
MEEVHLMRIAAAALVCLGAMSTAMAEQSPITGGNYLYIQEYVVGPDMTPDEAVARGSEIVRAMRNTGEYRSVRLYIHNTGPQMGIYVLAEPNSWQAIEMGANKAIQALGYMSQRWGWASHSDNLMSEIQLESGDQ